MTQQYSLTAHAHFIIGQHLNMGDIAIDATLGNGHDTLFLAKKVGIQGIIFGFDTQQQALESTRSRLKTEVLTKSITLNHVSHDQMSKYIPDHLHGKIKVIMFNLGYLPGSDKSIITQVDSTLSAVKQAVKLIALSGIITIMAYPGHAGGDIEMQQIMRWCKQLNTEYFNIQTITSSEKKTAPRLFIIKKTKPLST